jgi:hypothetical protein
MSGLTDAKRLANIHERLQCYQHYIQSGPCAEYWCYNAIYFQLRTDQFTRRSGECGYGNVWKLDSVRRLVRVMLLGRISLCWLRFSVKMADKNNTCLPLKFSRNALQVYVPDHVGPNSLQVESAWRCVTCGNSCEDTFQCRIPTWQLCNKWVESLIAQQTLATSAQNTGAYVN